ncbi:MAG: group II intron maturase-specific domain-containing protein [Leptospirales bacterium]
MLNVMLDEVDKELERRGHRFVRYADDSNVCNVYVRSQRAGERVLQSLRRLYAKLRLKVNEEKTAVGTVFGRKFLGHCFRRGAGSAVKIAVAPKAVARFKQRIREITCRSGGRSMAQVAERMRQYMPGWRSYFRLVETSTTFKDLDSWIRHRLRALQLKHWRCGPTIYSGLRSLGASHELATMVAGGGSRWWHNSRLGLNKVLTVSYFDSLGVPRLS